MSYFETLNSKGKEKYSEIQLQWPSIANDPYFPGNTEKLTNDMTSPSSSVV